jgi:hypothetical protein
MVKERSARDALLVCSKTIFFLLLVPRFILETDFVQYGGSFATPGDVFRARLALHVDFDAFVGCRLLEPAGTLLV